MLVFIKTLHTVIWVIMTAANFLAFYFAFIRIYDLRFWIPCLLIISEIFIILFNDWHCPITPVAAKYTNDRRSNFDIYLPEWLAKNNVKIFSVIIVVEILVVGVKEMIFS